MLSLLMDFCVTLPRQGGNPIFDLKPPSFFIELLALCRDLKKKFA